MSRNPYVMIGRRYQPQVIPDRRRRRDRVTRVEIEIENENERAAASELHPQDVPCQVLHFKRRD